MNPCGNGKNSPLILAAREFLFLVETTLADNGKRYSRCCERKEERTFFKLKSCIRAAETIVCPLVFY